MHPGSKILLNKHPEEQILAIKLRVGEVLEETKSSNLIKHLKFDWIVSPELEKVESPWTHNYYGIGNWSSWYLS